MKKKKYFITVVVITFLLVLFIQPVCYAAGYVVNEVTVPLTEPGYRAGDYRGAGLCWEFAQHVYYNIWHRFFSQNAGSEDDLLREYPGGEERRITAQNAKLFVSQAPVGSVIRLQAILQGPDSTKCNRHSLILLDKSDKGCTVYHDWSGFAMVSTFTWKEFEYFFRKKIDFGYFKYIKFPGAQALTGKYMEEEVPKELVVSSRLYPTAELLERKRD